MKTKNKEAQKVIENIKKLNNRSKLKVVCQDMGIDYLGELQEEFSN